jgi:hypothetical protein
MEPIVKITDTINIKGTSSLTFMLQYLIRITNKISESACASTTLGCV